MSAASLQVFYRISHPACQRLKHTSFTAGSVLRLLGENMNAFMLFLFGVIGIANALMIANEEGMPNLLVCLDVIFSTGQ